MRELMDWNYEHEPAPSQPFALGQWYERRGRLHKALSCFKAAALDLPVQGQHPAGQATPSELWMHYGRIQAKLNRAAEADQAFRQALLLGGGDILPALQEWAALLHKNKWSDSEIYERFRSEDVLQLVPPQAAGEALMYIGAYAEAARCYDSVPALTGGDRIRHIQCLILCRRLEDAVSLILQWLQGQDASPSLLTSEESSFANHALLLCQWRLHGIVPEPAGDSAPSFRQQMANTAIALGMLAEAEQLLQREGRSGELLLIQHLYEEGYFKSALERLQHIHLSSSELTHCEAARIQMIRAELLYDQHLYAEGASAFKLLRLQSPHLMLAKYGEAACCLQASLSSLSARIEKLCASPAAQEQVVRYMECIHSALHVLESSGWHTSWTPGQLRRETAPRQAACLN
ncbi:hypothetical protein ACH6EH_00280 [Paenibacillus sp. JSM ZJ436]|uniref:hypothetical protein n=1 Tax=Paenibacillus sp. JSM ZJ436 TaxID=3376190 RepID=UPI0037B1549D